MDGPTLCQPKPHSVSNPRRLQISGYDKNPFNFQNLVEEIALYVNGESMLVRPMKIDVETNQNHVTPFFNLFEAAEKWNKDAGLEITRSQFAKGYGIYAFSLDPSELGEEYLNLVKQGKTFDLKLSLQSVPSKR